MHIMMKLFLTLMYRGIQLGCGSEEGMEAELLWVAPLKHKFRQVSHEMFFSAPESWDTLSHFSPCPLNRVCVSAGLSLIHI